MPVLVLFLSVSMLAGSDGLGRIPVEDHALASSIGRVTLALSTIAVEHTALFAGLPLPTGIDAQCATLSLGALLALAAPQRGLTIRGLGFEAGPDPDLAAVIKPAAPV